MTNWHKVVVGEDTPLAETLQRMDQSGLQIGLVLDAQGRLSGVVTDGDIRRALLHGRGITASTGEVMNGTPLALPSGTSRQDILTFMRAHSIQQVPLVDGGGRLADLATIHALIGAQEQENWVVLMAGGLGMRLRPLTETCPKPLLPVGGKPILETILENFVEQGFRRFFIAVNYKAEMIRQHFGDGKRWGIRIDYLEEKAPLGTAGALTLLPEKPSAPVIAMNGDLLTRPNFATLLDFHASRGALATMAVREFDYQVPYGVVRLDGDYIASIEEKPIQRFYVNAGIYVISPEALARIPDDRSYDMPSLFQEIAHADQPTAAFPLQDYWLDIGRVEEFERAQREWPVELGGV